MSETKKIETPKVYVSVCDIVRGQDRIRDNTPAIRFEEGGQELAVITLSGYKIGHEMSPMSWAAKLSNACNVHDDLVNGLKRSRELISFLIENDADIPTYDYNILKFLDDIIAKAKVQS